MTCRFKVGQKVKLVRKDAIGHCHFLLSYIINQQTMTITEVNEPDRHGQYHLYGIANPNKPDSRCYFYDTMCDPLYNAGDIVLRLIGRNGASHESYIPEKDYDQMGLADIAKFVLGYAPLVSGVKSRIETPDCTILTIGAAE